MIKLCILNMKGFLKTLNTCTGPVRLVGSDGGKEDINKNWETQKRLEEDYERNKGLLRLTLEIPEVRDYLDLVCTYASNFK